MLQGIVKQDKNTSIMDKGQALDIARKYKAMVSEHLPLKALYLYGSYSKGNYTEESDIDIAVVDYNIRKLKKQGRIVRIGGNKGGAGKS